MVLWIASLPPHVSSRLLRQSAPGTVTRMCRDPPSLWRDRDCHLMAGLGRAAHGRAVGPGSSLLAAGRPTEQNSLAG